MSEFINIPCLELRCRKCSMWTEKSLFLPKEMGTYPVVPSSVVRIKGMNRAKQAGIQMFCSGKSWQRGGDGSMHQVRENQAGKNPNGSYQAAGGVFLSPQGRK
jgi:hypothetical protein